MSLHKQLLRDVFYCTQCKPSYGFKPLSSNGPYSKFPPTIGALDKADLLFVGINPRISDNSKSYNKDLFQRIMTSKNAFADLAVNLDGSERYIAKDGKEKHYHHHVDITEAMFGMGAKFEEHAAVTELFFCATKNAQNLPKYSYPCADLFFDRVFLKVRPRLVVCVWKSAFEYFRRRFGIKGTESFLITIGGHKSMVVYLPHPNTNRR